MQSSFQLPKQFSEELVLFAAHTPALQKYSEISESNTQISKERLGLGEARTNTWCDFIVLEMLLMEMLSCVDVAETLTPHFPKNHQLNLACLERVKQRCTVTDIFPFSTPKQPMGSHHPLVTAGGLSCS